MINDYISIADGRCGQDEPRQQDASEQEPRPLPVCQTSVEVVMPDWKSHNQQLIELLFNKLALLLPS